MADEKITYIFPSRERNLHFFVTLDSIISHSAKENFCIIAALDEDDESMCNVVIKEHLKFYKQVTAYWGLSKNKVHAINRECDKIPEDTDIVILVSDDQKFIIHGFDDIIRTDAQKYFKDKDFCLHYNDGTPARDKMITMNIFGITYFRRFNYMYNPLFCNVYCDNLVTEIAKKLGKYKYIPHPQIYSHLHPVWGTAPNDELYKRNEEPISYQKDKDTYFKLVSNNFGL